MSIDATQSSYQDQARLQRTLARLAAAVTNADAPTGGVASAAQARPTAESPTAQDGAATATSVAQPSQPSAPSSSTIQPLRVSEVAPGECDAIPTFFWAVTKIEVTNLGGLPTTVVISNPVTGGTWPETIAPGDTWHEAGHYWGILLVLCNEGPSPVHVYSH
jgi:hypothetical protein